MAIALIQMPSVNPDPSLLPRPQKCPNPECECQILQRWGIVSKPLRDTEWEEVQVYRYRCIQCYPVLPTSATQCYPVLPTSASILSVTIHRE